MVHGPQQVVALLPPVGRSVRSSMVWERRNHYVALFESEFEPECGGIEPAVAPVTVRSTCPKLKLRSDIEEQSN